MHERDQPRSNEEEATLSDDEWMTCTLNAQQAHDDAALMLVLKECFNQINFRGR